MDWMRLKFSDGTCVVIQLQIFKIIGHSHGGLEE